MILVAGSANLDFVVRAEQIPAPGQTVLGREFCTFPGGKGANQALACARAAGAATQMLLGLGADAYAVELEHSLTSAGVQLHVVRCTDKPTGSAFICVADDGQNAITVAPGANQALGPGHWPNLPGLKLLLMQLETPLDTVLAYALAARTQGAKVVLNAAPAQPLPRQLLHSLDLLIVNEGELALLAGDQGSIAERLRRLDVAAVVVTLGALGCCGLDQGRPLLQTGFEVTPLDTTGAGDTFCGVLAAAWSQGQELAQCLRPACAAAALACTRMGAQSSVPDHAAVQAMLAQQPVADPARLAQLRRYCGLSA